jgi:outer membrane protein assembly factor BamB
MWWIMTIDESTGLRMRIVMTTLVACIVTTASGQEMSWPQFRGTPQLTGVTTSSLPPALKVRWTLDAGGIIESSAAIADGTVFVGSGAGELIAADLESGAVRWKYKAGECESSPAVANASCISATCRGCFTRWTRAPARRAGRSRRRERFVRRR